MISPPAIRLAILGLAIAGSALAAPGLAELMPRPGDETSMWWRSGNPQVVEGAPAHRCVRSGRFAIVVDTDKLAIPHFGVPSKGQSLFELPPAELELTIQVNGKTYRCTGSKPETRFTGPRLVESGRFFQRADVTGLVFVDDKGDALNTRARFETAAWSRRLGLVLDAMPGSLPIQAGEVSFGKLGGGFGLDGKNSLTVPHSPEIDPEQFTLELWAYVPDDYRAGRNWPWLVCKNRNEAADGHYGIQIVDGKAVARLNIGGGRDGLASIESRPLRTDAWNHLALSYDGDTLRLYANGAQQGLQKLGKAREPGKHPLAFGRREDGSGDGYPFRGVIDELRIYDRALSQDEIRTRYREPTKAGAPVWRLSFKTGGFASERLPKAPWHAPRLQITLKSGDKTLRAEPSADRAWLALDPVSLTVATAPDPVQVTAGDRPMRFDAETGWHAISLDGLQPTPAPEGRGGPNDVMERIPLRLVNPTDSEQVARLMFEKTARGIAHRTGFPITGMSAVLRDSEGRPTGIPVQLSKNWHNHASGGPHSGQWFHGITRLNLPPRADVELELSIVYGHWGGVAAASHAQLSLIGWGGNDLWEQSALGSWGESICYDPEQAQAGCSITDVRPLMVTPKSGEGKWSWTNNVGGGDFFRLFGAESSRVPHAAMQTAYHRYGPCLTEVTYSGRIGAGIRHSETVSLARTDDIVRGTFRIRMDVEKEQPFSRFVIFQIGADTYNFTREAKFAVGNVRGVRKQWATQPGGDTYRTGPIELNGASPWVSMHEGAPPGEGDGAWANRGLVIREWQARLGGEAAPAFVAERGTTRHRRDFSTIDLVPPPGVTRLLPGDFVEATLEYLVVPQKAADYYGPNDKLRAALQEHGNTWQMIHREAVGNARAVANSGQLVRRYPDIGIRTENDKASLTVTGGLGYVPITIAGLSSHAGYTLTVDGEPLGQSVHGNDYWQTDYDPESKLWSRTYNVPMDGRACEIRLGKTR